MTDRKDPVPDAFAGSDVRAPRRLESLPTSRATQPQQRMRTRVFNSAGTSLLSGTPLTVSWDSESFDLSGLHETSVNPTRITVPNVGKVSGMWQVVGVAQIVAGANAGVLTALLRKSGTDFAAAIRSFAASESFTVTLLDLVDDPSPGDYFEMRLSQGSGATCTVAGGSTNSYLETIHLW